MPEHAVPVARPVVTTTPDASPDEAFKALASAQRRELLRIIAANSAPAGCCSDDEADEVCACTLSDALELAPSTISHHMSALVRAGLVTARKHGLWVHYRLDREALARVVRELESL